MNDDEAEFATLIDGLLNCEEEGFSSWLECNGNRFSVALLQAVKDHAQANAKKHGPKVDRLTRYAKIIATHMDHEPLGASLAAWARGLWGLYYNPKLAVDEFQVALEGYAGHLPERAALYINLVGAFTEYGRFGLAEATYHQALATLQQMDDVPLLYPLVLGQNYGWLLHQQGRYEKAISIYQRVHAEALPIFTALASEMEVNRAVSLGMLGHLSACEEILFAARQAAVKNGETLTVARIDLNLGYLYTALGRPSKALPKFHSARCTFATAENYMELGTVLMSEAALFLRIGIYDAARTAYEQAISILSKYGALPLLGQAKVQLARVYHKLFRFLLAEQALNEAEALWREQSQPYWLSVIQLERVALALTREDFPTASNLLNAPLAAAANESLSAQHSLLCAETLRQHSTDSADLPVAQERYNCVLNYASIWGDRWLERQALAGLGQLLLPSSPATGLQYIERAVEHDDQTRQMLSVEELKASFQTQSSDLLPILVQWALTHDQPQQALSCIWRAKTSPFVDLQQDLTPDLSSNPALETELHDLRTQISAQHWLLVKARQTGMSRHDLDVRVTQLQALQQRLFDLRRQRNVEHTVALSHLWVDTSSILLRLDADLLLEYFQCGDMIVGISADRTGICRAVPLAPLTEVLELFDRLQNDFSNALIQSPDHRRELHGLWNQEYLPTLQQCYKTLIAPLVPECVWTSSYPHLLIAPCDPLFRLPFAAFADVNHFLVEKAVIEFIPSGGFLALPQSQTPSSTAPALGPAVVIAATDDGSLPAARFEALAIGKLLHTKPQIDELNTIAYLVGLQKPPQTLHIAAHTVLDNDAPIFSALQLTKEFLSVEQMFDLPLNGTQLVTLGACRTVAGLDTGGALLSFQSAFFLAGARNVLISLWPVDDDGSKDWMEHFYQAYTTGEPPASAVRAAQLALLAKPSYSHPAFWSVFVSTRR